MNDFLKLIRWPNLLIVIASIVFTLYFVVSPVLGVEWLKWGMDGVELSLLLLSTVSITAGGYLINDFFDREADSVNKPGSNLVGKKFAVNRIRLFYWIVTIFGVLCGTLLSWRVGQLNYALIFVFTAGLLWLYSERYQCIPLAGNAVVAFLSALSFGLAWVFEFSALSADKNIVEILAPRISYATYFVLIYMGFAFLTSLLREVIKDMEDIEGDERYGCPSFAVRYGLKKSTLLAQLITVAGFLFTLFIQYYFYSHGFMILTGYFIAVDVLFVVLFVWIQQAKRKQDYKRLSSFIKTLMVIGILSMILLKFEM